MKLHIVLSKEEIEQLGQMEQSFIESYDDAPEWYKNAFKDKYNAAVLLQEKLSEAQSCLIEEGVIRP